MPFVIFETIVSLRADHLRDVDLDAGDRDAVIGETLRACSYCSEDSSSALDGMQPTLRQVPPSAGFPAGLFHSSTQAVFRPSWAARIAAM